MPQSTQHEQTNKFSFELLYRANLRPPPRREVLTPALPFYERHPEWKPRRPTRRQLRRRVIRGG
jgi:hypothetical protein